MSCEGPPLRVLIVGASSGLGRALALTYAEKDNAQLVLAARSLDLLDQVAEEAVRKGATSVVTIQADVTDQAQVTEMMQKAADCFAALDIIIINSGLMGWSCGIMGTDPCALDDMNKALLDVNYFGVMHVLKAAIPYIRDQWQSCTRVAITSAMAALAIDHDCLKQPYQTIFASSKLAIDGLVKSVRMEECFPLLVAYPSYICGTEHYDNMLYPSENYDGPEPLLHLAEGITPEAAALAYRYGIQEQEKRIFLDPHSKVYDFYHGVSDTVANFLQCFISQPLDDTVEPEERIANELHRHQIPKEFLVPIGEFYNEGEAGVERAEKTVQGMVRYLNENSTAELFHAMRPAQRLSLARSIVQMEDGNKQ